MTKNQFLILRVLFKGSPDQKFSQRELSKETGLSLGTVNNSLKGLITKDLIDENYQLSPKGYAMLEKYKVRRAIFLAAGFGERLIPLTLTKPKPLLEVKGQAIIEGFIETLQEKGIQEIIIVTGHLSSQFEYLKDKYDHITLIHNELFNQSKNISSAYLVKDLFSNAYVFEADLYLKNKDFIETHFYQSMYKGTPVEISNTWCFKLKSGLITDFRLGGKDVYEMAGVSYWNREDGVKLEQDIGEVYAAPGGKERFWDEVPLIYKKENYAIELIESDKNDILEINSLEDYEKINASKRINF